MGLFDDGFDEVSYAHRSTVVSSESPDIHDGQEILMAGWPGTVGAANYLNSLEIELTALERMYGQARQSSVDLSALPEIVHFAGHGDAGLSITSHWMQATETIGELLTPAGVLLNADASRTELVYLSACSTGAGVFGLRSVMEAVPLDVAFLERGATCVVSTSAPVNDVIASMFAITFHAALRAGAAIWEAYIDARSATSTGNSSPESQLALDTEWSSWRVQHSRASARHPDDWMRFRLSGRHW